MAHDIFGGGLDRDVDAMGERLEVEGRCPRIVQDDHRAGSVRGFHDRRNVLHLEGLRARRLGEHDPCLLGDEALDTCPDQGVVIDGGDAEPLQHIVAEAPVRAIDGVSDKNFVARRHEGKQRRRDGGKA